MEAVCFSTLLYPIRSIHTKNELQKHSWQCHPKIIGPPSIQILTKWSITHLAYLRGIPIITIPSTDVLRSREIFFISITSTTFEIPNECLTLLEMSQVIFNSCIQNVLAITKFRRWRQQSIRNISQRSTRQKILF